MFLLTIITIPSRRHPNICLMLAYSTIEDSECIISELMRCSLLDVFVSHIVQGTKMPHRQQIQYAQQLAQGMNYLHTCKPAIIHRDLKPANLLVDHSGTLKISDFGLAKVRPTVVSSQEGSSPFVMTGETGSYRFMAPEVYLHKDYNETVDVYSYAMIMYYLLSGKPPWPTLDGLVAVRQAANDGDRPIVVRKWDQRLASLLVQCWDENTSLRPPFHKILVVLADYVREYFSLMWCPLCLLSATFGA